MDARLGAQGVPVGHVVAADGPDGRQVRHIVFHARPTEADLTGEESGCGKNRPGGRRKGRKDERVVKERRGRKSREKRRRGGGNRGEWTGPMNQVPY